MKVIVSKGIIVTFILTLLCFGFSNASVEEAYHGSKIILKPNKDNSGTVKPEIPPLIQLIASIDKDQITITSSENVTSRITITDHTDEECYFDCVATISPTYSFYFYPPYITEELTLHVIIGDKEYIGFLDPVW